MPQPVIAIPATALTKADGEAAVWVVDPADSTVSLRNVEVLRHDPDSVVIAEGLEAGDIVVTAGVQALHPGPDGAPPGRVHLTWASISPTGPSGTAPSSSS